MIILFRVKDQQNKTMDLSELPSNERIQKTKALVGNMLSYDNGHYVCIVFEEPKNILNHIKFIDNQYTLKMYKVSSVMEVKCIYSMASTSLDILFHDGLMLHKELMDCYASNIKIGIMEQSLEMTLESAGLYDPPNTHTIY